MEEKGFMQLPLDVMVQILSYLQYKDLLNLMLTCKTMKDIIVNENSYWREASHRKLIVHGSTDNSNMRTWTYYNKCHMSYNWRRGIFGNQVLINHRINYMPWLKMHNTHGLLLTVGSQLRYYNLDGKGIPIWKLKVPVVKRHDIRTNDISRFVIKDNLIICGNRDGCAALYQMKDVRRRPDLLCFIRDCHLNGQVEVSAVELFNANDKPCIITASSASPNLCFWKTGNDTDDGHGYQDVVCSTNIDLGAYAGIRCLQMDKSENKVCVGLNGNNKPILVDVETGHLLFQSEAARDKGERHAVRDVFWHNENVVIYVTHSGLLQLLDDRSGNVIYKQCEPFLSTLYCVKSDGVNAVLVGSSEYSRCILFDTRHQVGHVQVYFTQKKSSPIYSLDFDCSKLIAAADKSVAVLDFNVSASSVEAKDYSDKFYFELNRTL